MEPTRRAVPCDHVAAARGSFGPLGRFRPLPCAVLSQRAVSTSTIPPSPFIKATTSAILGDNAASSSRSPHGRSMASVPFASATTTVARYSIQCSVILSQDRREVVANLGAYPSNRRDRHIRSCCAPTISVAALRDGRVTGLCPIEREERIASPFTRRGDTGSRCVICEDCLGGGVIWRRHH